MFGGSSYLTGMVVIQLSTLGGGLSQELLSLFHLVVLVHSIQLYAQYAPF